MPVRTSSAGMRRTTVSSGTDWERRVGYARAVRAGRTIHVSGTVATDDGAVRPAGDPAGQARRALDTIEQALVDAGGSLSDVVRTRIYLTDVDHWEAVGPVHEARFGDVRPATTMVAVAGLIDPAALVEIEAEAIVGLADDVLAGG